MTHFSPPAFPVENDVLTVPKPSADMLGRMARRRSTRAIDMSGPGPSKEQLDTLIRIAARVPDHGKLFPWRFIVFEGEARPAFGQMLESLIRADMPEAGEERLNLERRRFERAPVVIGVISRVTIPHKIPEWEQILSAGAVCQNLLLAADAMGFGAQWLTEWYAFDERVKSALGLEANERVAGFVYVGTQAVSATERPRKPADITRWTGKAE
ncbi:MAG: nitroreductase family protein [Caulobacterales bacterium]|uniref:nitroreductase family protein n=1 Tax=Glycocaulis sp. TaxID=1969725 RepID=UPI003FA07044